MIGSRPSERSGKKSATEWQQREGHRLSRIHAVGTGTTELIHIGQAVLELGGRLDYFLSTAFNYPTLAECYKVAASDAFNKLV